jgi:hypothetical protein
LTLRAAACNLRNLKRSLILLAVAAGPTAVVAAAGAAVPALVTVTSDPFTNSTSKHRTAVEPGSVGSTNRGQTWAPAQTISPEMRLGWLPDTSQGEMVGDYISTSFVGGKSFRVFSVARLPPALSTFNQVIQTTASGLTP